MRLRAWAVVRTSHWYVLDIQTGPTRAEAVTCHSSVSGTPECAQYNVLFRTVTLQLRCQPMEGRWLLVQPLSEQAEISRMWLVSGPGVYSKLPYHFIGRHCCCGASRHAKVLEQTTLSGLAQLQRTVSVGARKVIETALSCYTVATVLADREGSRQSRRLLRPVLTQLPGMLGESRRKTWAVYPSFRVCVSHSTLQVMLKQIRQKCSEQTR